MKNSRTHRVLMIPSEKPSPIYEHIGKLIFSNRALQGPAPGTRPLHIYIPSNEEITSRSQLCIGEKIIYKNRIIEICDFDPSGPICTGDIKPQFFEVKKIIASTDKEITPRFVISESFIRAYIKASAEGKPITEVDLEFVSNGDWDLELSSGYHGLRCRKCMTWIYQHEIMKCDCGSRVRTNQDGFVTIRQSKTYTREQVEDLIHMAFKKITGASVPALKEFIDNNL